jgi:hypothetical protein
VQLRIGNLVAVFDANANADADATKKISNAVQ